jgi:tetratricopeptide (TPR) repeat protein/predicted Ser/Thr protein kinase
MDSTSPLDAGTTLGRYRIDALIGTGGMGAVYLAYDTVLKRPLAMKVLHGSDSHDHLLREAQSASALSHSAICTVYEVGGERGIAFIAMEYVDGEPLAMKIAAGPLALAEIIRYGIEVSDALAHAHDRGVIHRDLKAANVIVSGSDRIKVVDFGLARRLDPDMGDDAPTLGSMSGPGVAIGTPYAMAPEQVKGGKLDHRTDVWALGVLLYEMASGHKPFGGSSLPELMAAILRDEPAPLKLSPAAEPMRAIIHTCLAKDPERRYQRAEDVKLALQALVTGTPTLTDSGRRPAPMSIQRPPLLERTSRESAFVGREHERGRLAEAWSLAKAGTRHLCLIAGEPGIGKTRLALEFARQCADENATVLVGRCDEEALVPYQPFVEAIGWYARTAPDAAFKAAIPANGAGDLAAFAPEFLARLPNAPEPTPMNAAGQRYRLFESVSALLSALSSAAPVLLLIEDLHWADKPTLSLLRHVVRGSDPAALLLLGTYRDSEVVAGHPLGELLADFRREPAVTRVVLAGLEPAHVGTLIAGLSAGNVAPGLARQVVESTGGNPFFVSEMARHLNETGSGSGLPEGIREVILRRVSRLSETCVRTLTLAAVVGREFDLDLLEGFADTPENDLLDAIDEARQAQLLDEAVGKPGRYSFHHALIRNALYDSMASTRRVRIHRRVAEALEKLSAQWAEPPLADLAYHFTQAASAAVADRAADYATRAADRMAAALAHEEAARFYDYALRALDSLPASPAVERQRVAIHRRRGRAFGNLGQWGQQRAALETALQHVQADQAEERCEILADLGQAHFWLFDIPSLERVSTEALKLAEELGRADLAAIAMGWLARCGQAGGNVIDAIERDRETIERFGESARISHSLGSILLYWAGRGREAAALAANATAMADQVHDATFTMYSLSHSALALAAVGRYADASRVFSETRAFGRKYGVVPMLARAISMSGGFPLSLEDYETAEEIQLEARELARSANFAPSIVSPSIDLLLIAARRGDPGSVESLFDETVEASKKNPGWHGWLWELRVSQVRAELAYARGDWNDAIAAATVGIEQCRRCSRLKYESLALVTRAQALWRLKRSAEAIADAREAVRLARATEDPALLLRASDTLLALDGDDALAAEAKATIARIIEGLPEGVTKQRFIDSELVRRVSRF